MKSTQQEIIDRGLKPRKIIFDVINLLIQDRSKKYKPDDKANKIILWHVALSDLSDDQIRIGMVKISRTKNEFIPDSGTFYEICSSSNPAKQYVSQSEPDPIPAQDKELNNHHYQKIINKLGLPERLKANEFKNFKANRKKIESTRKLKLLEGKKNANL